MNNRELNQRLHNFIKDYSINSHPSRMETSIYSSLSFTLNSTVVRNFSKHFSLIHLKKIYETFLMLIAITKVIVIRERRATRLKECYYDCLLSSRQCYYHHQPQNDFKSRKIKISLRQTENDWNDWQFSDYLHFSYVAYFHLSCFIASKLLNLKSCSQKIMNSLQSTSSINVFISDLQNSPRQELMIHQQQKHWLLVIQIDSYASFFMLCR